MGAEANSTEENLPIVTPENVEALLEAARYDDIDDVRSLASSGISLDSRDIEGRTECSAQRFIYRREMMEELQGSTGPIYHLHCSVRKALHMASANGHLGIVEYLVSSGVDVNAYNVEKNTPLHWACLNGHAEVVKSLILAGADVSFLNSHERTPVDEALHKGNMDMLDAINTAMAQVELTSASVS